MDEIIAHGFENKTGGYRELWYVSHMDEDWPYGIRISKESFEYARKTLITKD